MRAQVGGVNLVLLVDCEEFTLQKNLTDRASQVDRVDDSLKAIGRRIAFFKSNALPILGHYDDLGKLQIVSVPSARAHAHASCRFGC